MFTFAGRPLLMVFCEEDAFLAGVLVGLHSPGRCLLRPERRAARAELFCDGHSDVFNQQVV